MLSMSNLQETIHASVEDKYWTPLRRQNRLRSLSHNTVREALIAWERHDLPWLDSDGEAQEAILKILMKLVPRDTIDQVSEAPITSANQPTDETISRVLATLEEEIIPRTEITQVVEAEQPAAAIASIKEKSLRSLGK